MRRYNNLRVVVAVSCGLAVGCESSAPRQPPSTLGSSGLATAKHREDLERIPADRHNRLARGLEWVVASESVRPARLAWMLDHAAWYVQDQADDLSANLEWGGRLLERDLNRVNDQLPRAGAVWVEMLAGNPDERIARHAVRMFY